MSARVALAAAALFCLAAPARAQETEAAFTQRMVERFRAAIPDRKFEVAEPLQLRIVREGDPYEVNVGRIFNYCRSSTAEECESSIATFVTSSADAIRNVDPAFTSGQLRVAVRSSDYCDYIDSERRLHEKSKSGPLRRPYVAGVCTLILADFPTIARGVSAEDLEKIGLDVDAAWALAERQTLADLPTPTALDGLENGISIVDGFDYAPSIMLNAEGWREASARGEILIAVPSGNSAIVVRRATITDLDGFRNAVREHFETAERQVSPLIYRWTTEGWKPID
jgi:hypothetical protein